MGKIKTFLRRVASGSFKRFFNNLNVVHTATGKNRVVLFFDMVYCMFAYGIGYLDYVTFGFADIRRDKRKTFMTMNDNQALAKKLNAPDACRIFDDKLLFFRHFSKYLNRDYADLQDGFEKFQEFCQNKTCFFAKRPASYGGMGVEKVHLEGQDLQALYQRLISEKKYLAEEAIVQHPQMNLLCDRSVNTIRIVTVLSDKGNANFVYALVRVGSGTNDVDNITSGGMYTLLSPEGKIEFPMFCDKTVSYYTHHPASGFSFQGFTIPMFQEAVALCKEAAYVEQGMRYIGWDVAITPDGPVLVEGNDLPGYDMCQNHMFHPDRCGMRQAFQDAITN